MDKLFSQTGYHVPQKIEIGGLFLFDDTNNVYKKYTNLTFNSSTEADLKILNNKNNFSKMSNSYLENLFRSSQTQILGGDTLIKDFEKWEKTLSINNAVIIGYKNLTDIISFIPSNYLSNLQGGINYLNIKYKAREK